MKGKLHYLLVTAVTSIFLSTATHAQEIVIQDGETYIGCGATIVDTGGNPSEYGNNENITFQICPEGPDTLITIEFLLFSLGAGDTMNIYEGFGTGGTLIGSYTGFDIGGQAFTSPSGDCITVEFTSDDSDVGNFAFLAYCGTPCERPIAIVDAGGPNPIRVCVGDEITFDGTGSEFADGTVLESYEWDFGDGTTDNSSGLVVSHSYDTPGEYRTQLFLTDDNECSSINLPDVQILVGTTPTFDGSTDSINICLGQEVDLLGEVEGTLWNGQPENPIGGYLEIPDDQSQCFSSEIIFSNFTPGQTIESAADFESVFVNMEHSYMGDLIISLICPDGSSIDLHQQGGGGTFLGVPNDPDIGMEIQPGEGFDYFWAPDAANGTWLEESFGVGTLPSGTYSSVQPFDDLIGCPMNGVWTLQICDLFGADNGVVFDWTVTFDPSLYPEITQFTPVYGAGCDSTSWSGPDITSTGADCNSITVLPGDVGSYTYTYEATDNHGCTYGHPAIVTVEQGPLAEVQFDTLSFCGDPVDLVSFVSNSVSGENYIYEWSPAAGLDNPNSATPSVIDISADQNYTVFIYQEGEEVCGSEASVFVEFVPPVFSEVEPSLCDGDAYMLPDGEEVFEGGIYLDTLASVVTGCDSVVETNLSYNPVYLLDVDAALCGNETTTLPDGTVVNETGVYPVQLQTMAGCDSTIITTVVAVSLDAGEYNPICPQEYPVNLPLDGFVSPEDPESTVTWSGPEELSFANENSLQTFLTASESGAYNVELTDSRCPDSPASALIIMRSPPQAEFSAIGQLCIGESIQVSPILTGDYAQPPYIWQDDLGFYFEEDSSSILVNGADYVNYLNVMNEITVAVPGISPCPATTASFVVEVIDCEITIPNIFTPNGDASNNTFEIQGIENFPGSSMVIYNRWGKVVYESDSYGSPFWNGNHYKSGAECAEGVYYYELVIPRLEKIEKGTITLLRN